MSENYVQSEKGTDRRREFWERHAIQGAEVKPKGAPTEVGREPREQGAVQTKRNRKRSCHNIKCCR